MDLPSAVGFAFAFGFGFGIGFGIGFGLAALHWPSGIGLDFLTLACWLLI